MGRWCVRIVSSLRSNRRGVSIIGTVFTLIILGVMGAALVAIVAMDQESRMVSIRRERAFYAVQAGLEYALREIKEGGYPIVANTAIGEASFTTTIDAGAHRITVVGAEGTNRRTHSITTSLLAGDCAAIDVSGASVGGIGNDEVQNILITQSCLNAVRLESMTLSWVSDVGERLRRVQIDGINVYDDPFGIASGETVDVEDVRIVGAATINAIEFSSSVTGKTVSITLTFTDASEVIQAGVSI